MKLRFIYILISIEVLINMSENNLKCSVSNYFHYGCNCSCRLCRKGAKTTKMQKYYPPHLICFKCRLERKGLANNVKSRSDPDDCSIIFSNHFISINKFSDEIKCSKCNNNMFVAGYDLRIPKYKNIKEWEILEEILTNKEFYYNKILEDLDVKDRIRFLRLSKSWKHSFESKIFNFCPNTNYQIKWFPKNKKQIIDFIREFIIYN